jgi:hypothetical protein
VSVDSLRTLAEQARANDWTAERTAASLGASVRYVLKVWADQDAVSEQDDVALPEDDGRRSRARPLDDMLVERIMTGHTQVPPNARSKEVVEAVRRLAAVGMSAPAIGLRIGRSGPSIVKLCGRNGISTANPTITRDGSGRSKKEQAA